MRRRVLRNARAYTAINGYLPCGSLTYNSSVSTRPSCVSLNEDIESHAQQTVCSLIVKRLIPVTRIISSFRRQRLCVSFSVRARGRPMDLIGPKKPIGVAILTGERQARSFIFQPTSNGHFET